MAAGFWLLIAASSAGAARALFHYAEPPALSIFLRAVIFFFLGVYMFRGIVARRPADLVLSFLISYGLIWSRADHLTLVLAQSAALVRAIVTWPEVRRRLPALRLRPALLIVGSFATTIVLGTALLLSPRATAGPEPASLSDALFTSTSATCVTGLIVRDTGTYWSPLGQGIILALIQVGGLGIMTLWAGLLTALGGRLGLREQAALGGLLEVPAPRELRRMIRHVIAWTFATEIVGAVLLYPSMLSRFGDTTRAATHAGFHSVSAFCNAGFALWADNLESFAGNAWVCFVMMALIVLGGFGFPVLMELGSSARSLLSGRRRRRLSVYSRLVIGLSFVLIALGTMLIFHLESADRLGHLGPGGKLLAALFQSVTARTAGFNTVPMGRLSDATLLVLMALMFIGAAPASTGGGIKTSTLAVLLLAVRSFLRVRAEVEVFGRRVPALVVQKAIAITLVSGLLLVVMLVFLLAVEPHGFAPLAFESVSAFGTVGLSTGVTAALTLKGRLAIIMLMFLGRIGPLTLALAVGVRARPVRYRHPEGHILVG
jgi:trk system potassium uptake protein TrkH